MFMTLTSALELGIIIVLSPGVINLLILSAINHLSSRKNGKHAAKSSVMSIVVTILPVQVDVTVFLKLHVSYNMTLQLR
jgi:hypothetical protein